jgi:hypothetical protein
LALLYIDRCGTFEMILEFVIFCDANIYPIMPREQWQLIDLAQKARTLVAAKAILAPLHRRVKECDRMPKLIVDRKRTFQAGKKLVDGKDEAGGVACSQCHGGAWPAS